MKFESGRKKNHQVYFKVKFPRVPLARRMNEISVHYQLIPSRNPIPISVPLLSQHWLIDGALISNYLQGTQFDCLVSKIQ